MKILHRSCSRKRGSINEPGSILIFTSADLSYTIHPLRLLPTVFQNMIVSIKSGFVGPSTLILESVANGFKYRVADPYKSELMTDDTDAFGSFERDAACAETRGIHRAYYGLVEEHFAQEQ